MARFKFKKAEGSKDEGEKPPVAAGKGDPTKGTNAKGKGAEKAARRYGAKEVKKGG